MRHIRFKPSDLSDGAQRKEFAEWLWSARKATRKICADVAAGKEAQFNPAIWSRLKKFLLKHVFHGKCAYCESRVTTTDFGDAEHYRPKAGVTYRDAAGVLTIVKCNGREHPGYYWLAYDWRNLLPACAQCNSGEGKLNLFPIKSLTDYVASPKTARVPSKLDSLEKPSLLHPYYDKPEQHLQFGLDGTVAAHPVDVDGRGHSSITTYNLQRGDLETTRREYQEKAWGEFLKALSGDAPLQSAMEKYVKGQSPYSLACLHYVELKYKEREAELRGLFQS